MMLLTRISTTISYLGHLIKLLAVGIKRNILRIHGVGGAHRMDSILFPVRPRYNRSETFRKRYRGRRFLNIWER